MNKNQIYKSAIAAILLPHVALAQAVITEIMYDPPGTDSGHEWIEVYNSGATAIPLASWKLSLGGSNHKIIPATGGKLLAASDYAVIAESVAKFESDHPDYNGPLFHSAFSLNNAGDTITLYDASSTVVSTASYDSSSGAVGDGNSLARPPDDTAEFSPHLPTPGMAMSSEVVPSKLPTASSHTPASNKTSGKTSKKKTATGAKSAEPISPPTEYAADTSASAPPSVQIAAVAATKPDDSYWWLAALTLVIVAIGAILTAKYFKKGEWDIVEESLEDV